MSGTSCSCEARGCGGCSRGETLAELVQGLVEFYQPECFYLFGSAARGDDGPDSDLDLCVVLPDEAPESLYRVRRRFSPGDHPPRRETAL